MLTTWINRSTKFTEGKQKTGILFKLWALELRYRGMVKTATNQKGDRTKQRQVKTATGTLCG